MNVDEARSIVVSVVGEVLQGKVDVTNETHLIGGDSPVDSMSLVQICVELEDLAEEHGFEFDWTSDAAMSKSRSMFRDVMSLAEEFADQSEA